nr:outer membrane beta-barrel protein [uncultured Mucilaginibacter sp.]
MKGIYLTLSILLLSLKLLAQTPVGQGKAATANQIPPALEFRDVSGIVKDEKDDPVPGAVVLLKSPLDSVLTTTNSNGIFIFKQVKRAGFYITVSGQGIPTTTKLYRNNDLAKQIVLDPIELKPPKAIELKEVTINGAPTIIYKQDTVEYKASDYKVREGDTLDELLKKMEGFDVGRDGTLLYQGQEVKKGRLNGKDFIGGDVKQIIQNLPAEIIEKAQVIDDYGDQAAKTGIKSGEPTKLLNVTTKPERSIGTYMNPTVQAGNNSRYNGSLSVTHLNANRQIGIIGRISNSQNGVSSGVSGGGGAGTTLTGNPSISYSDQWTKLRVTSSYNYTFLENTSINKSFGETYSYGETANVKNTSFFNSESTSGTSNRGHRGNVMLNYDFDKYNNIQVSPTFNYTTGNTSSNSLSDNINNFTYGFEHRVLQSTNENKTSTSGAGVNVIYQHIFKKPRRNVSVALGINSTDNKADGKKFTDYRFYKDETQDVLLRDSVAHLLTRRTSNSTLYNTTVTFLEPLTQNSQLEFTGRFNRTVIDNSAKADTVLANGQLRELTRLSNIFNYAVNETRLTLNYTYNGKKINLSAGGTVLPTVLTGTRINNNTNQPVSSSFSNFRIIPVLRFTYIWSTSQRFNISYSGNTNIPEFQQIQPFTDRSDPINIITGNPNLKPAFTNSLNASYNNYIANSKINISLSVTASEVRNKVVYNVIQRPELISTSPNRYRTIFETTFINLDGVKSISGNYQFSKQLADRRYTLSFSGGVNYGYNVAMSNNVLYHGTTWGVRNSFGPKINPNDVIEISPSIQHQITRTFTSLPGNRPTLYQTTSLVLDGRFVFNSGWRFSYNASKNFVTGLSNFNTNPLVINAGAERQITKKNNLYLTFNVYDILKQNNFIQQSVTAQGVTNTLSNSLSRYFMVGLRATFQKWGGRPKRNGQDLKRKGDGSFIY